MDVSTDVLPFFRSLNIPPRFLSYKSDICLVPCRCPFNDNILYYLINVNNGFYMIRIDLVGDSIQSGGLLALGIQKFNKGKQKESALS